MQFYMLWVLMQTKGKKVFGIGKKEIYKTLENHFGLPKLCKEKMI